jgi:hypothetical protein
MDQWKVPKWLNGAGSFNLENGLVFELQSIRINDCNLVICSIESKILKKTKAIR